MFIFICYLSNKISARNIRQILSEMLCTITLTLKGVTCTKRDKMLILLFFVLYHKRTHIAYYVNFYNISKNREMQYMSTAKCRIVTFFSFQEAKIPISSKIKRLHRGTDVEICWSVAPIFLRNDL